VVTEEVGFDHIKVQIRAGEGGPESAEEALEDILNLTKLHQFGTYASMLAQSGHVIPLWEE
jgi:hypothetical protein